MVGVPTCNSRCGGTLPPRRGTHFILTEQRECASFSSRQKERKKEEGRREGGERTYPQGYMSMNQIKGKRKEKTMMRRCRNIPKPPYLVECSASTGITKRVRWAAGSIMNMEEFKRMAGSILLQGVRLLYG